MQYLLQILLHREPCLITGRGRIPGHATLSINPCILSGVDLGQLAFSKPTERKHLTAFPLPSYGLVLVYFLRLVHMSTIPPIVSIQCNRSFLQFGNDRAVTSSDWKEKAWLWRDLDGSLSRAPARARGGALGAFQRCIGHVACGETLEGTVRR